VADEKYQLHTSSLQAGLCLACLLSAGYDWYSGKTELILGLILSGLTNGLLAWEKVKLIRRGKP
jgi:hypothetical protein